MTTKVAVVTGGNKGIGLAIVEKLAAELKDGWAVLLTARNPELGQESVDNLAEKGLTVRFHQLDITSESSLTKFAAFLKKKYGGLDILVNNAGIAFKNASTVPLAVQAEVTMSTNFFGTLKTCGHLFPLLRPHARVVNMSSFTALSALNSLSPELKSVFVEPMDMSDLCWRMDEYVSAAQTETLEEQGWPTSTYATSKLGVTVMSMIQQREFDDDSREDLIVNACCPGHVSTDMSSHTGSLTPEEGSDTPVYLALLPPNADGPKGKHVAKRQVEPWQ